MWCAGKKPTRNTLPNELACHAALHRASNIVELSNWENPIESVDHKAHHFTVYTKFCQHGSLADIVEHYREVKQKALIPEPFIWCVAESLLEANLELEHRSFEIVHR